MALPLIETDPLLKPYTAQLRERFACYQRFKAEIEKTGGVLGEISQGHRYFGFNRGEHEGKDQVSGTANGHRVRKPLPLSATLTAGIAAQIRCLSMIGASGIYSCPTEITPIASHTKVLSRYMSSQTLVDLTGFLRICERVVQEGDADFTGQYWAPSHPYQWQHRAPDFGHQY